MQYFLFPFYEYGATGNILLCPKCYIGMYLMDMVYNFDFLNQTFLSKKITPALKKLKPWQVYVKYSNTGYRYIAHLNCLAVQAGFYSDVVECSLSTRENLVRSPSGKKDFFFLGRSFLSVAWPTGVQLVFFFCSGVSRLFGAQGSPSSGSLPNL